jgi:hypothetical protein
LTLAKQASLQLALDAVLADAELGFMPQHAALIALPAAGDGWASRRPGHGSGGSLQRLEAEASSGADLAADLSVREIRRVHVRVRHAGSNCPLKRS